MIRLPRVPAPARPLRPPQRAVLFAAGLLLLYAAVALRPSAPPPARSGRLPAGTSAAAAPGVFTLGLALVLAVLAGGGAFAFHLRRKGGVAGAPAPLRSLGALTVGTGGQVRLVRCAGDVLLLGVTAQGITVLQRYDAAAYDAATAPEPAPTPAEPPRTAPRPDPAPAPHSPTAGAEPAAPVGGDGAAFRAVLADAVRVLTAPLPEPAPAGPAREYVPAHEVAASAWAPAVVPVAPLTPLGPVAPRADA